MQDSYKEKVILIITFAILSMFGLLCFSTWINTVQMVVINWAKIWKIYEVLPNHVYGKRWFCLELPFLINLRSMIMNICKPCEKFESGVNQWKYIHGFADPLPYISEMIKSHEQLLFEERRIDGVNPSILLYRCLKCGQSWELLSWEAIGQLDIQPHFPRYNSST